MSLWELKSLTSGGIGTVASSSRLRSGSSGQLATMSDSEMHEEALEAQVQELRQKLTMAERALETMSMEFATQLEQNREMAEMAKSAKEESEEHCQKARELERELHKKSRIVRELEEKMKQQQEEWSQEKETANEDQVGETETTGGNAQAVRPGA